MGRRKNNRANRKSHYEKKGGHGGKREGAGRPEQPLPELPVDDGSPAQIPESLLPENSSTPRQDRKLIRHAIRNHWPIKGAMRRAVVESAEKDLPSENPKVRSQARKDLLAADKVNVQREALTQKAESGSGSINVNVTNNTVNIEADSQHARLSAIAAELGFEGLFEPPSAGIIEAASPHVGIPCQNGSAHSNGSNGKTGGLPHS